MFLVANSSGNVYKSSGTYEVSSEAWAFFTAYKTDVMESQGMDASTAYERSIDILAEAHPEIFPEGADVYKNDFSKMSAIISDVFPILKQRSYEVVGGTENNSDVFYDVLKKHGIEMNATIDNGWEEPLFNIKEKPEVWQDVKDTIEQMREKEDDKEM